MPDFQNDTDGRWHLDKRVNISHLLTTVGLIAAVFSWGSTVETRLALVERDQSTLTEQVAGDLVELKDTLKELRAELRDLRRDK